MDKKTYHKMLKILLEMPWENGSNTNPNNQGQVVSGFPVAQSPPNQVYDVSSTARKKSYFTIT